MKIGFLIRDYVGPDCVMGALHIDGHTFYTLEPPWLNNKRNISCIPSGVYECEYMRRSSSGKYRQVYWLQDVFERSGILIHNGNLVNHTKGCLILGNRRGRIGGKKAVLSSRLAMRRLNHVLGGKPFKLMILGNQECSRQRQHYSALED